MTGPPSPLIEDYLRKAGFWHVAMIGRGCKLDPKLISALIERWRPKTHTFHLPCGECTITLEDVHLQLGLSVDGDAVTGSVHFADWGAVCYELLGAIPDNINGGRIEIGWLRDTFPEPDDDSIELEKIRYARAYILQIIREQLVNLVGGLPCWQHCTGRCAGLRDRIKRKSEVAYHYCNHGWNHSASYARLPTCLEDIRLLLEQRSEAQFQWTPYEDPAIRAVIPDEYLQNPNAWHVKVPLVNFAIVEMHQSDRVLRQFGFRQPIPVALEERQRQLRVQRERHGPLNPRRRDDDVGPSTAPTQSPSPATGLTQSPGPTVQPSTPTAQPLQMMPGWNAWPGSSPFLITPSGPLIYRQPSHEGSQEGPSGSYSFYQSPSPYGFQTPPPLMIQTPPHSLFYQGGSSSQHPQPESSPEQAQPPPEAGQRKNPTRNRRRPSCGTESHRYRH
ncbi:hypothetical protein PVK06_022712 [Gossypium arboreum]|uniref:Aminotransferase-like plant mobile domain-containing protein n=1 Tax=Gossypium arboreum TaxID=29729 RepID=A0ABR0P9D3_GOSAR|nr:hypothetical protein PVK06_022712 [Gossypium arboreum]